MAQMSVADVHTNELIGDIAVATKNTRYIAGEIAPIVNVVNESNKYMVVEAGAWLRDEATIKAEGQGAAWGSFTIGSDTYDCEEYAYKTPLSMRVKRNADPLLMLEAQTAEFAMDKVLLARERRVAGKFFTAAANTTWTNSTTLTNAAGTQWDQYESSDSTPVSDIDTAMGAVEDETAGLPANTLIFGTISWRYFRRHPAVISLIYGGGAQGPKIVTPALVAAAFEVERVLVGKAIYTADIEDQSPGTISKSKVWGPHCWVGHVTNSPSLMSPTAVATFRQRVNMRTFYEDSPDTDWYEASEVVDEKVVAADSGYLIFEASAAA